MNNSSATILLCFFLLSSTGCAGMGGGQSGPQGPLPSTLEHAYNQCKDGGGRECFERILGSADHVGPTASGKLYMRWVASPRTRSASIIFERSNSPSGPCKLEINLDDNKMVKWLFTGICQDEILVEQPGVTQGSLDTSPPPRMEIKLPSTEPAPPSFPLGDLRKK